MNTEIGDTAGPTTVRSDRRGSRRQGSGRRVIGVVPALAGWCVLAVGLITSLVVVHGVHWYPQLDLAMTELRVRDVASAHPPLIGLIGRIGTAANQGSHPGPISFYMLWPFYQLFGGSAWALEAASVCLHALAAGIAIAVAHRRGRATMALAVATMLTCLVVFFGPFLLIQPWNPYLPMIWWIAFLFAAWSVMCGDVPMLPVAVLAGSVCVQTHISYAVLVAGVALLVVGALWMLVRRSRPDAEGRRRIMIWSGVAIGVLLGLWLPPLLQQLSGSHGNLGIIVRYFANPPESPIGFGTGVRIVLVHLNPWTLVQGHRLGAVTGSILPGVTLLVVWSASVVVAVRAKRRQLVLLNAVLGVALFCCVLSASRIFGHVFFYLVLWGWSLCAVIIFAVAWAAYDFVRRNVALVREPRMRAVPNVLLAVVLVVFGVRFVNEARDLDVAPSDVQSAQLGTLVKSTLDALRSGTAPGGGEHGTYLVAFDDPFQLGAQAFGLLDELERSGFHVGMTTAYRTYVQPHRVLQPRRATAEVLFVVGPKVAVWQSRPGVREVAYLDPRTAVGRLLYARLTLQVLAQLREAGRSDLVPELTNNVFGLATDARVPAKTRDLISQMLRFGQQAAVFVGPVDAFSPPAG
jgi:hypothetical protein